MSETNQRYRVESFDKAIHADQLMAVWGSLRHLGAGPDRSARFRWLYEDKPDGDVVTQVGIHGGTDEVIGAGSAVPRSLCRHDGVVSAAILGDLAVVPHHRTAGPAVKVLRSVTERALGEGRTLLYASPNDKSAPIFKRLRFDEVGRSRCWRKPLKSSRVLHAQFPSLPLANIIGSAVDVGHRVYDWTTYFGDPRFFRTAITERADESFDTLWECCDKPHLTGEKSSVSLNWRYARHPVAAHHFFRLYGGPGRKRLLGFVVYTVEDDAVTVADLFCDYARELRLLLFAFSERMRAEGHVAIAVTYLGHRAIDDALHAQHFFLRDTSRPFYVIGGDPATRRESHWALFEGDLDI